MLSKNTYPAVTVTILLAILAIVAVYLFTLPYFQLDVSSAVPDLGSARNNESFDAAAAAEHSAARWQAQGEFFTRRDVPRSKSADDQIAFRWREPARYYEALDAAGALGGAYSLKNVNPEVQHWQAWQAEQAAETAVEHAVVDDPEVRIWRTWQANYGNEGPQEVGGEKLGRTNPELRIWRTWQANYGSDGPETFDIDEASVINSELRIWRSWQENYK